MHVRVTFNEQMGANYSKFAISHQITLKMSEHFSLTGNNCDGQGSNENRASKRSNGDAQGSNESRASKRPRISFSKGDDIIQDI